MLIFSVRAEQQERHNDRASERDQQVPQRPRLAESGNRSHSQNDPDCDAEQPNRRRQRGELTDAEPYSVSMPVR